MKKLKYRMRYYLHKGVKDRWMIYDSLEDQIIHKQGGATLEEALEELNRLQTEYEKKEGIEPLDLAKFEKPIFPQRETSSL